MKKIFRHWKIIYAVCCLFYIGWMVHVGGNEFDRINGQYRMLVKQLEPGRVRAAALEELAGDCMKSRNRDGRDEETCSSWEPSLVEARIMSVTERRLNARQRGFTKNVLFYSGFVVIFLLAPVVLTYLLIVGIILLKKNIRIVREQL